MITHLSDQRGFGLSARLRGSNPYTAVAAVATRNPRVTFLVGGTVVASLGVVLLIAISSIQAFVMISQQSATNSRASFATQLPQLDDVGLVGDAALLVATEGIGVLTGGIVDPGGIASGGDAVNNPAAEPAAPAVAPAGGAAQPTAPVTADDVVAVYGIRVHQSIAEDVRNLIDAAAADGITLSGWGWRDSQTQIRLRREHCGTSEYAIYQMPSSQCRPPTARPGRSQHERGLAIDFTYNGGSISTRSNLGFRWLEANAATYGLKNLASEPWHWSTTGR